jgi:hypothetical protein
LSESETHLVAATQGDGFREGLNPSCALASWKRRASAQSLASFHAGKTINRKPARRRGPRQHQQNRQQIIAPAAVRIVKQSSYIKFFSLEAKRRELWYDCLSVTEGESRWAVSSHAEPPFEAAEA